MGLHLLVLGGPSVEMFKWLVEEFGWPYGLPVAVSYIVISRLLSHRIRLGRGVPLILLSLTWTLFYRLVIYPPRPTPNNKIGVWIPRIGGDIFNRVQKEYLDTLEEQSRDPDFEGGITVQDLKFTLEHGTLDSQPEQARKNGREVNADVVLWVVIGRTKDDLYAVYPREHKPQASNVGEVYQLGPGTLLRYLAGNASKLNQRYFRCIQFFSQLERRNSPLFPELDLADCYIRLGREQEKDEWPAKAIEVLRRFTGSGPRYVGEERYASAMNLLGFAFANLAKSSADEEQNRQAGIDSFRSALSFYSKERFPIEWATSELGLGEILALSDRRRGEASPDLPQAISAVSQALQVFSEEMSPGGFADANEVLCNVYSDLPSADPRSNLGLAEGYCKSALRTYKRLNDRQGIAVTSRNLGFVYVGMADAGVKGSVSPAVNAFRSAEEIWTRDQWPRNYASIQAGICSSGADSAELGMLQQAAEACESARRTLGPSDGPYDYAVMMNRYGLVKLGLAKISLLDRLQLLRDAQGAFREANSLLRALPDNPNVIEERSVVASNLRSVESQINQLH